MKKNQIIIIIGIIVAIFLIGIVLFGIIGKMTEKYENPIATIKFEGYEEPVVVELYPDQALNTVKNFIALSNGGFYDGLIIHRIEKDFVIQGGSPKDSKRKDSKGNEVNEDGPTLSWIDSSIAKESDADKAYSINRRICKKWL